MISIPKKVSPYVSIFGLVLVYILLTGVVMFTLSELENSKLQHIVGLIGLSIYVTIIYLSNKYYFKKVNLEPPKLIRANTSSFKSLLIGLLLALVLLFPTRIIEFFKSGNIEYLIIAFTLESFGRALYASVTEEIVFRGTLLNFFTQKNRRYIGLVISTLIFTLLHLGNLVGHEFPFYYVSFIAAGGLCYGLVYLNFGLIGSISFHFIYNFLVNSFVKTGDDGYYILGIEIVLCILLFFRDRRIQIKSTKANNVYNS